MGYKIMEYFVPHTAPGSAAEPLVHALVLAITLRKIVPTGTGTDNPENDVDEGTVVRRGPAHRVRSARKQTLDPQPRRIAPSISTHAI